MLLVKKVEVIKTERNWHKIYHMSSLPDYVASSDYGLTLNEVEIEREMVEGRHFVNEHGEETVIGWTIDVQETLGLPFEVFNHHNADAWTKHKNNEELRKQLGFRDAKVEKLNGFIDGWKRTTDKFRDRLLRRTEISNRFLNLNFMDRLKFLFLGRKYLNENSMDRR